ncbi:MAG: hypothetical protein VB084_03265 [Syntrophomonadaceae bacterium]|nr:hypothetical protein [Syntrophomonadaceae bacterium]
MCLKIKENNKTALKAVYHVLGPTAEQKAATPFIIFIVAYESIFVKSKATLYTIYIVGGIWFV